MACSSVRRQGFTLVELLVVIAIISIIAGLVIPGLTGVTEEACKLECTSNLRGLHSAAFIYARKGGAFPLARPASAASPRAHESLNVLLRSPAGAHLEPASFCCPEGEAVAAEREDARSLTSPFVLEEWNLDYAWVGRRTSTTERTFLASDKYHRGQEHEGTVRKGHRDAVLAVDTTGRVQELAISDPLLTEDQLPLGLVR